VRGKLRKGATGHGTYERGIWPGGPVGGRPDKKTDRCAKKGEGNNNRGGVHGIDAHERKKQLLAEVKNSGKKNTGILKSSDGGTA